MTAADHEFVPLHSADSVADYFAAACSCGWTGAYSHAAERFAREDHAFHVERTSVDVRV
jgi:hypothetical protein